MAKQENHKGKMSRCNRAKRKGTGVWAKKS